MAGLFRVKISLLVILVIYFYFISNLQSLNWINLQWTHPSRKNSSFQSTPSEASYGKCRWHFLNYTSSQWETFWYTNIEKIQHNVCETLSDAENLNNSMLMLQRVMELQQFGRSKRINPQERSIKLLSRMFYRQQCVDLRTNTSFLMMEASHLIEPLIGLLRDPFTICPRKNFTHIPSILYEGGGLQSKRFILLSVSAPFYLHPLPEYEKRTEKSQSDLVSYEHSFFPWLFQRQPSYALAGKEHAQFAKIILFDLGSSYFGGWKGDSTAAAGFWFYEYHRRFGIKFDRIVAFEHSLLDQKTAWEQLPDEVFPIYTLINVGVSANETFNPWRTLRALANKNDHVIVKLDIDTPPLENSLINQVVDDNSIYTLIDELCFEHHTNVKEMIPFWGHAPSKLQDSYTLFTKIRKLGIRMHSWP
jgi:hypothetical protein